jgi:lipopolysaccharide export system permease protein
MKTEIHKKIAFSFATLVFVLVGIPTAIISRRGEAVVSFSVAMGLAAFYYVLFVLGRTMAVNGSLTPWIAMWLPNVLLAGIALFLGKRLVQL